ncbi:MAG: thiamine phosphate synthase [Planctomycetota bacterium]
MDSRWPQIARGLDAALNRLGEALRTVEDRLRFDRSLPVLPGRWREIRGMVGDLHRELERRRGPTALHRDVAGDPGAPAAEEPAEPGPARRDLADLLAANLARAREAARSVEEALRAADPHLASRAERIRYRIYTLEGATAGLLHRGPRLEEVRLYVLLTAALASRPLLETAAAALAGGAQMLQLREKEMPDGELLPLARQLRELTSRMGALLIINDRADIAALSGADGVHLGQEDLPVAEARRITGADAIIGVSTHDPAQARRAQEEGADYIGVGPIFPTRTKEHRRAVGIRYIGEAAEAAGIPGFAIGSVGRDTIDEILAAGARRVAICTAIIARKDVEGSARWFSERLQRALSAPDDH